MTVSRMSPVVRSALRTVREQLKEAEAASAGQAYAVMIEHCIEIVNSLDVLVLNDLDESHPDLKRWTKGHAHTISHLKEYQDEIEKGTMTRSWAARAILFTKILIKLSEELLEE